MDAGRAVRAQNKRATTLEHNHDTAVLCLELCDLATCRRGRASVVRDYFSEL